MYLPPKTLYFPEHRKTPEEKKADREEVLKRISGLTINIRQCVAGGRPYQEQISEMYNQLHILSKIN